MVTISGECDSCGYEIIVEVISVPHGPVENVNGYQAQLMSKYGRFISSCEHCLVDGNIATAVCKGHELKFEIMPTTGEL